MSTQTALNAAGDTVYVEGVGTGVDSSDPFRPYGIPLEQTGTLYSGATALTVKYAKANVAAGQTDASVIAAVATKKLRVLALVMLAGGTATTITFTSKPAGAGAAISPLFANAANGGAVLPFNPHGWFETVDGEGLSATTGAGSATGVLVVYVEV